MKATQLILRELTPERSLSTRVFAEAANDRCLLPNNGFLGRTFLFFLFLVEPSVVQEAL